MSSPDVQQQHGPTDPAIAPEIAGAPVVKKTERPHPATPFIRGWLVLVAILVAWGRELLPDGSDSNRFDVGDLRWILLVIAAAVLLAAVVGFLSWYFTRFIIDDDELRIETGAVFKNSKKIPFERLQSVDIIQPLAARMFGLAELRLEAGAGDSTTKLRYLSRAKASRLRDYLLTRGHGQSARIDDLQQGAVAHLLTDLGTSDQPLVKVSAQRLILGFVLSSEWLVSLVLLVVAFVVTASFGVALYALGGLIPLALGAISLIGRRVVSMFNFTLAESARGLRITRGLTNLTSQSVPIDRIQGVKTTQPLLWRSFGFYRVDVDVVGYGNSSGEANDSSATSVLLPVATLEETRLAIARVLPGIDLDAVDLHPSPRRARWVRWFDFWTLRYGWDEQILMTTHGWLTRVRNVVPHAKTQSVRIEQGPLQRKLRLADVHIDTPKGPVNVVAQELDVDAARELAMSQLDRARAARAAVVLHQPVSLSADLPDDSDLLASLGVGRDQLIGAGGESEVFALDEARVLRLYHSRHEAPQQTAEQLRGLYQFWSSVDIGIEIPSIQHLGEQQSRWFTVDRRFSGGNFSQWLRSVSVDERRAGLASFLDATQRLHQLPSPVPGFARLVGRGSPQQFGSLPELLNHMLAGPTFESRDQLTRDLPSVGQVWEQLQSEIAQRRVVPALTHGDVCASNAYLSVGPSGPVVTGIGDFSPHTVNGDPMMDLAGAVVFLELEPYPEAAEDSAWLEALVAQRHGPESGYWINVYRRFYGFYFSNTGASDPASYGWCLRQLRR